MVLDIDLHPLTKVAPLATGDISCYVMHAGSMPQAVFIGAACNEACIERLQCGILSACLINAKSEYIYQVLGHFLLTCQPFVPMLSTPFKGVGRIPSEDFEVI